MAGRRNSTPLFDLIGPQREANEKPRYRSSAPPPAPSPSSVSASEPPVDLDPVEAESTEIHSENASVAVAVPRPKPIEVFTPQTLPEPIEETEIDEQAAQTIEVVEEDNEIEAEIDESSTEELAEPLTIETRHAPHGHPTPAVRSRAESIDDIEDPFTTQNGFAAFKSSMLVGTNRIYLASGLAIIGLVVVWFILNAILSPAPDPDLDTSAGSQLQANGGIDDPLNNPSASSGGNTNRSESAKVPTIQMGGSNKSNPSPTPIPTLNADPRVVGQNYLLLASRMGKDEATRAASFLAEQGCPAIAVGMDSGTLEGNNREQFLLVSLFDVPVGRYSAMRNERTSHVARVGVLGEIWTKDHGGTVNFHDPYWKKFDP